jgi:serine/threonine protein kinase
VIKRDYEILLVMPYMEGGSLYDYYLEIKNNHDGFDEETILFFAV